jgi:glutamate/tyrosine decarboxylase-like PLP-dependent enzyme
MSTADALRAVADLVEASEADARITPLRPRVSPQQLAADFDGSFPDKGMADGEWLALLEQVIRLSPPSTGPAYFNLLFASRIPAAIAAEALVGFLNNTMHTYKAAGVHILIEKLLIGRLNRWAGFDAGEGLMVPGGSVSILVAMALARNRACPGAADQGTDGRRYVVYRSADGHYSVDRGAGILGIGRDNVRAVPTDSNGRMDVQALREMIEADQAIGAVPTLVQATSGTTVRGAFDDLNAISEVCTKHGIWMHIDAAYGGATLVSQAHRHLMTGSHRADSLTWDCHKLMGVPVVASFFLTRHRGLLREGFAAAAPYLLQADGEDWNPSVRSMQTGRRNDALKVWATLRYHGISETAARIDRLFTLTAHARQIVVDDPQMQLFCEPEYINLCFYVRGKSSARLCTELDRRGLMMCSYGSIGEHRPIRLVLVNPDMPMDAVDGFFEALGQVAATLPNEPQDFVP